MAQENKLTCAKTKILSSTKETRSESLLWSVHVSFYPNNRWGLTTLQTHTPVTKPATCPRRLRDHPINVSKQSLNVNDYTTRVENIKMLFAEQINIPFFTCTSVNMVHWILNLTHQVLCIFLTLVTSFLDRLFPFTFVWWRNLFLYIFFEKRKKKVWN